VSQVLLLNDQSSGVGALLEKSRLQGVLRGTPNGEVVLERVMADEQVQPGETVLTSGGDQIFPKGLPVGRVTKVGTGRDLFLNIQVKPSANLSQLEEVLVVVEKQEQQPVAEDNVRIRAADILAQRLPSVPDKPADPTAAAGTSSAQTPVKTGTTHSVPSNGVTVESGADNGSQIKPPAQPKPPKTSSTPLNQQPVNQQPAGDEARPN
jgi:rod shape-determining protein MreC